MAQWVYLSSERCDIHCYTEEEMHDIETLPGKFNLIFLNFPIDYHPLMTRRQRFNHDTVSILRAARRLMFEASGILAPEGRIIFGASTARDTILGLVNLSNRVTDRIEINGLQAIYDDAVQDILRKINPWLHCLKVIDFTEECLGVEALPVLTLGCSSPVGPRRPNENRGASVHPPLQQEPAESPETSYLERLCQVYTAALGKRIYLQAALARRQAAEILVVRKDQDSLRKAQKYFLEAAKALLQAQEAAKLARQREEAGTDLNRIRKVMEMTSKGVVQELVQKAASAGEQIEEACVEPAFAIDIRVWNERIREVLTLLHAGNREEIQKYIKGFLLNDRKVFENFEEATQSILGAERPLRYLFETYYAPCYNGTAWFHISMSAILSDDCRRIEDLRAMRDYAEKAGQIIKAKRKLAVERGVSMQDWNERTKKEEAIALQRIAIAETCIAEIAREEKNRPETEEGSEEEPKVLRLRRILRRAVEFVIYTHNRRIEEEKPLNIPLEVYTMNALFAQLLELGYTFQERDELGKLALSKLLEEVPVDGCVAVLKPQLDPERERLLEGQREKEVRELRAVKDVYTYLDSGNIVMRRFILGNPDEIAGYITAAAQLRDTLELHGSPEAVGSELNLFTRYAWIVDGTEATQSAKSRTFRLIVTIYDDVTQQKKPLLSAMAVKNPDNASKLRNFVLRAVMYRVLERLAQSIREYVITPAQDESALEAALLDILRKEFDQRKLGLSEKLQVSFLKALKIDIIEEGVEVEEESEEEAARRNQAFSKLQGIIKTRTSSSSPVSDTDAFGFKGERILKRCPPSGLWSQFQRMHRGFKKAIRVRDFVAAKEILLASSDLIRGYSHFALAQEQVFYIIGRCRNAALAMLHSQEALGEDIGFEKIEELLTIGYTLSREFPDAEGVLDVLYSLVFEGYYVLFETDFRCEYLYPHVEELLEKFQGDNRRPVSKMTRFLGNLKTLKEVDSPLETEILFKAAKDGERHLGIIVLERFCEKVQRFPRFQGCSRLEGYFSISSPVRNQGTLLSTTPEPSLVLMPTNLQFFNQGCTVVRRGEVRLLQTIGAETLKCAAIDFLVRCYPLLPLHLMGRFVDTAKSRNALDRWCKEKAGRSMPEFLGRYRHYQESAQQIPDCAALDMPSLILLLLALTPADNFQLSCFLVESYLAWVFQRKFPSSPEEQTWSSYGLKPPAYNAYSQRLQKIALLVGEFLPQDGRGDILRNTLPEFREERGSYIFPVDSRYYMVGDAVFHYVVSRELFRQLGRSVKVGYFKRHLDMLTSADMQTRIIKSLLPGIGGAQYRASFFEFLIALIYMENGKASGQGIEYAQQFVFKLFAEYRALHRNVTRAVHMFVDNLPSELVLGTVLKPRSEVSPRRGSASSPAQKPSLPAKTVRGTFWMRFPRPIPHYFSAQTDKSGPYAGKAKKDLLSPEELTELTKQAEDAIAGQKDNSVVNLVIRNAPRAFVVRHIKERTFLIPVSLMRITEEVSFSELLEVMMEEKMPRRPDSHPAIFLPVQYFLVRDNLKRIFISCLSGSYRNLSVICLHESLPLIIKELNSAQENAGTALFLALLRHELRNLLQEPGENPSESEWTTWDAQFIYMFAINEGIEITGLVKLYVDTGVITAECADYILILWLKDVLVQIMRENGKPLSGFQLKAVIELLGHPSIRIRESSQNIFYYLLRKEIEFPREELERGIHATIRNMRYYPSTLPPVLRLIKLPQVQLTNLCQERGLRGQLQEVIYLRGIAQDTMRLLAGRTVPIERLGMAFQTSIVNAALSEEWFVLNELLSVDPDLAGRRVIVVSQEHLEFITALVELQMFAQRTVALFAQYHYGGQGQLYREAIAIAGENLAGGSAVLRKSAKETLLWLIQESSYRRDFISIVSLLAEHIQREDRSLERKEAAGYSREVLSVMMEYDIGVEGMPEYLSPQELGFPSVVEWDGVQRFLKVWRNFRKDHRYSLLSAGEWNLLRRRLVRESGDKEDSMLQEYGERWLEYFSHLERIDALCGYVVARRIELVIPMAYNQQSVPDLVAWAHDFLTGIGIPEFLPAVYSEGEECVVVAMPPAHPHISTWLLFEFLSAALFGASGTISTVIVRYSRGEDSYSEEILLRRGRTQIIDSLESVGYLYDPGRLQIRTNLLQHEVSRDASPGTTIEDLIQEYCRAGQELDSFEKQRQMLTTVLGKVIFVENIRRGLPLETDALKLLDVIAPAASARIRKAIGREAGTVLKPRSEVSPRHGSSSSPVKKNKKKQQPTQRKSPQQKKPLALETAAGPAPLPWEQKPQESILAGVVDPLTLVDAATWPDLLKRAMDLLAQTTVDPKETLTQALDMVMRIFALPEVIRNKIPPDIWVMIYGARGSAECQLYQFQEARATLEKGYEIDPDDRRILFYLSSTYSNLGLLSRVEGNRSQSVEYYTRAVELYRRVLNVGNLGAEEKLITQGNLASALIILESEESIREALVLLRKLQPKHPQDNRIMGLLGDALSATCEFESQGSVRESLLAEAVEWWQMVHARRVSGERQVRVQIIAGLLRLNREEEAFSHIDAAMQSGDISQPYFAALRLLSLQPPEEILPFYQAQAEEALRYTFRNFVTDNQTLIEKMREKFVSAFNGAEVHQDSIIRILVHLAEESPLESPIGLNIRLLLRDIQAWEVAEEEPLQATVRELISGLPQEELEDVEETLQSAPEVSQPTETEDPSMPTDEGGPSDSLAQAFGVKEKIPEGPLKKSLTTAVEAWGQGKKRRALEAMNEAVAQLPEGDSISRILRKAILSTQGEFAFNTGNYTLAIEAFEGALALAEDTDADRTELFYLPSAYQNRRDGVSDPEEIRELNAKTIDVGREALLHRDKDEESYVVCKPLAVALLSTSDEVADIRLARELLEEYIAHEPDEIMAFRYLGRTYVQLFRIDGQRPEYREAAFTLLKSAELKDPENTDLLSELVGLLFLKGREYLPEACAFLDKLFPATHENGALYVAFYFYCYARWSPGIKGIEIEKHVVEALIHVFGYFRDSNSRRDEERNSKMRKGFLAEYQKYDFMKAALPSLLFQLIESGDLSPAACHNLRLLLFEMGEAPAQLHQEYLDELFTATRNNGRQRREALPLLQTQLERAAKVSELDLYLYLQGRREEEVVRQKSGIRTTLENAITAIEEGLRVAQDPAWLTHCHQEEVSKVEAEIARIGDLPQDIPLLNAIVIEGVSDLEARQILRTIIEEKITCIQQRVALEEEEAKRVRQDISEAGTLRDIHGIVIGAQVFDAGLCVELEEEIKQKRDEILARERSEREEARCLAEEIGANNDLAALKSMRGTFHLRGARRQAALRNMLNARIASIEELQDRIEKEAGILLRDLKAAGINRDKIESIEGRLRGASFSDQVREEVEARLAAAREAASEAVRQEEGHVKGLIQESGDDTERLRAIKISSELGLSDETALLALRTAAILSAQENQEVRRVRKAMDEATSRETFSKLRETMTVRNSGKRNELLIELDNAEDNFEAFRIRRAMQGNIPVAQLEVLRASIQLHDPSLKIALEAELDARAQELQEEMLAQPLRDYWDAVKSLPYLRLLIPEMAALRTPHLLLVLRLLREQNHSYTIAQLGEVVRVISPKYRERLPNWRAKNVFASEVLRLAGTVLKPRSEVSPDDNASSPLMGTVLESFGDGSRAVRKVSPSFTSLPLEAVPWGRRSGLRRRIAYIDCFYSNGCHTGRIPGRVWERTENETIFYPSDMKTLVAVAEQFMQGKKVLTLGFGNAVDVAIFSLFAAEVTGYEFDTDLSEKGKACIRELAQHYLQPERIHLIRGDFFSADFSEFDVLYLYWPFLRGDDHALLARSLETDLERKILGELRRGALFILNPNGFRGFRNLTMVPFNADGLLVKVFSLPQRDIFVSARMVSSPAQDDSARTKRTRIHLPADQRQQFARTFRAARQAKSLTQKQIQDALGLKTHTTVLGWEKGHLPDRVYWPALKTLVGLDIEEFLSQGSISPIGSSSKEIWVPQVERYVGKITKERLTAALGRMIFEARARAGLSQDALGAFLGVSGNAIAQWEAGLWIPECDKWAGIKEHLGLDVKEWITKFVEGKSNISLLPEALLKSLGSQSFVFQNLSRALRSIQFKEDDAAVVIGPFIRPFEVILPALYVGKVKVIPAPSRQSHRPIAQIESAIRVFEEEIRRLPIQIPFGEIEFVDAANRQIPPESTACVIMMHLSMNGGPWRERKKQEQRVMRRFAFALQKVKSNGVIFFGNDVRTSPRWSTVSKMCHHQCRIRGWEWAEVATYKGLVSPHRPEHVGSGVYSNQPAFILARINKGTVLKPFGDGSGAEAEVSSEYASSPTLHKQIAGRIGAIILVTFLIFPELRSALFSWYILGMQTHPYMTNALVFPLFFGIIGNLVNQIFYENNPHRIFRRTFLITLYSFAVSWLMTYFFRVSAPSVAASALGQAAWINAVYGTFFAFSWIYWTTAARANDFFIMKSIGESVRRINVFNKSNRIWLGKAYELRELIFFFLANNLVWNLIQWSNISFFRGNEVLASGIENIIWGMLLSCIIGKKGTVLKSFGDGSGAEAEVSPMRSSSPVSEDPSFLIEKVLQESEVRERFIRRLKNSNISGIAEIFVSMAGLCFGRNTQGFQFEGLIKKVLTTCSIESGDRLAFQGQYAELIGWVNYPRQGSLSQYKRAICALSSLRAQMENIAAQLSEGKIGSVADQERPGSLTLNRISFRVLLALGELYYGEIPQFDTTVLDRWQEALVREGILSQEEVEILKVLYQRQGVSSPIARRGLDLRFRALEGQIARFKENSYRYVSLKKFSRAVFKISLVLYLQDSGKLTGPPIEDYVDDFLSRLSPAERVLISKYPVAHNYSWNQEQKEALRAILKSLGYRKSAREWILALIELYITSASERRAISKVLDAIDSDYPACLKYLHEEVAIMNFDIYVLSFQRLELARAGESIGPVTRLLSKTERNMTRLLDEFGGMIPDERLRQVVKARFFLRGTLKALRKKKKPRVPFTETNVNFLLIAVMNWMGKEKEMILNQRLAREFEHSRVTPMGDGWGVREQRYRRVSRRWQASILTYGYSRSQTLGEALRALDHQFDTEREEMLWIESFQELYTRVSQMEEEDSGWIDAQVESLLARLKGIKVEEKRLARIVLRAVAGLLKSGRLKQVQGLLHLNQQLFEARKIEIEHVIEGLKKSRLVDLREQVVTRNARLKDKTIKILGILKQGNWGLVGKIIREDFLEPQEIFARYLHELEFVVLREPLQDIDQMLQGSRSLTAAELMRLRKFFEFMLGKIIAAELTGRFMQDYRERYMSGSQTHEEAFREEFTEYLRRRAVQNAPQLWWAIMCHAAFVSGADQLFLVLSDYITQQQILLKARNEVSRATQALKQEAIPRQEYSERITEAFEGLQYLRSLMHPFSPSEPLSEEKEAELESIIHHEIPPEVLEPVLDLFGMGPKKEASSPVQRKSSFSILRSCTNWDWKWKLAFYEAIHQLNTARRQGEIERTEYLLSLLMPILEQVEKKGSRPNQTLARQLRSPIEMAKAFLRRTTPLPPVLRRVSSPVYPVRSSRPLSEEEMQELEGIMTFCDIDWVLLQQSWVDYPLGEKLDRRFRESIVPEFAFTPILIRVLIRAPPALAGKMRDFEDRHRTPHPLTLSLVSSPAEYAGRSYTVFVLFPQDTINEETLHGTIIYGILHRYAIVLGLSTAEAYILAAIGENDIGVGIEMLKKVQGVQRTLEPERFGYVDVNFPLASRTYGELIETFKTTAFFTQDPIWGGYLIGRV
ncbi:MAG: hypothetical protein KKC84_01820, partial [Candidatus Omnitrophica bacterium]|nr:hypothetical protein [Candidatus Omnitrophota bacterium]